MGVESFLISLAVSAAVTGASTGLQYALTPKPKKPDPLDRGKLDDIRFSVPGYGASIVKAFGTFRCAPTWFWHTPTTLTIVTTPGQQGGKGGGAPPSPDVREFTYYKNAAGVFHDGPIQYVRRIWFNSELVMNVDGPTSQNGTSSTRYEAENGVLAGTAAVTTQPECSEGRKVTGIGGSGAVTIHCDVSATAAYEVAIAYVATVDRTFFVSVNGGDLQALECPETAAGLVGIQTMRLNLTNGPNTIAFSNPGSDAPELDYITIAPALAFNPDATDPRSFTGVQTPGRIAPTDPDISWPVNDEIPVFSAPTDGLASSGNYSATLSKWGNPQIRIYTGSEAQLPDPLIESVKGVGNASAYRGCAYIVLEGVQLQNGQFPNVTIEFVEGTRSAGAIVTALSQMVGLVPSTDLDVSALNGLIIGDNSGFSAGTYSAITWTGLNNSTQTASGAITKTSGANNSWNAYAVQGTTIAAGTDAAIRFTAGNGVFMIGFATTATPGSSLPNPYNQVPFAIILNEHGNPSQDAKKAIQMSLGGSNNTTDIGVWSPGEDFQIEIRNGRFSVYQEGLLLGGFTPPPATFPLHPIFMGYSTGGGPSAASYATGANIGSEPVVRDAGAVVIETQREAADVLQELMTRFQFIMPEVDDKIKPVLLDAASEFTLTEAECQAYRGEGLPPKIQISRKDPLTFPKFTTVNYSDPQLDYHANAQIETRLYGPQKGTTNITLSMVETAANMKKLAAILSTRAEVEGQTYRFTVGPKHKRIHQGTVLTIIEGSSSHQVRVTNLRPDLPAGLIEVEAVRKASVFDPSVAVQDIGVEPPIVPVPGNTIGLLFDGPLLRAEDGGDGTQPVVYVGMCGRGSGRWPAGLMHKEFPRGSGQFVFETATDKASAIGVGSGPEDDDLFLTSTGKPGSGDSVDGCIARSGEATWAAAHDAVTGNSVDPAGTTLLYAESSLDAGTYTVIRSLVFFNTSAIPDDAIILSATLSLFAEAKSADQNDTIVIVGSAITSNSDYAVADFDLFGPTRFSPDIPLGNITTSAWVNFSLNAAGLAAISTTGTTKLGVRTGRDVDNVAPTIRRFVSFQASDHTGTENPKLSVSWVVPGLDPVSSATSWDRSSVMTANFYGAVELESVPESYLLTNPELNLLGVRNPETGEVEYVQFANATPGAAITPFIRKYHLSVFLRGRAMTEHNLSNHSAQDDLMVIDSTVKPRRFDISEIALSTNYRFLTSGQALDNVPNVPLTLEGRSLKPASVVNVKGTRDSGNDLLIEFMGRTRIGGGLRPLQGSAVGEEEEKYFVRPVGTDRAIPVVPGMALAAMLEGDGSSKFAHIAHGTLSIAVTATVAARSFQRIERTGNFIEANLSAVADVGSGATAVLGVVPSGVEWRKHIFPDSPGAPHLTSICPLLVILSHSDSGRTIQVNEFGSIGLAAFNVADDVRVHITFSGTEMRVSLAWAGQGTPAVFRSSSVPAFPIHALAFVGCLSDADTAAVSKITMTTAPMPKVIYAADQQDEDGFTPGAAITLEIWQHSSLIGDGNEVRVTL